MGSNYPRKEQLLKIAQTFIGQTLTEAAHEVSLISPEYLLGRFHKYNIDFEIDGPTFKGKITSITLPQAPNKKPETLDDKDIEFDDTGFGYIFPRFIPDKKKLKTEATVIPLPNDQYNELIQNFRRRHLHR